MTDTATEPPPVSHDPDLRVPHPDGEDHDYCDHDADQGRPCVLDDVHAGWDIGTWCRLNFVRQGDGTFYVSVHSSADPVTYRTVTPEQLRLMAAHLLAVADAS